MDMLFFGLLVPAKKKKKTLDSNGKQGERRASSGRVICVWPAKRMPASCDNSFCMTIGSRMTGHKKTLERNYCFVLQSIIVWCCCPHVLVLFSTNLL